MIKNILLTSEDYIKTNSNLSDNCFGKLLLPAIRDVQDIYLQTILGSNLYNTLLHMVSAGTIADQYKELMDHIQQYMLYMVLSDIVDYLDVKLANLGTYRNSDQYVENIDDKERQRLKQNYEYKAQFYGDRLVEFLLNNKEQFPELDECDCNTLKSHLVKQADTGLWLGGIIGKNTSLVK